MEVQGKIKFIGEIQEFGLNGFKKREVVITTDEQYPQDILIEFVQDKTDILNKYKVDQNVSIGINIRGREWINPKGEVKYLNSIQGWNIKELDSSTPEPTKQEVNINSDEDDLPF